MAASSPLPTTTARFSLSTPPRPNPNSDAIKQRLLRRGVFPTPKILHAIQKKEAQKAARRAKKHILEESETPPPSEHDKLLAEEEQHFKAIKREYRAVREELKARNGRKPWERSNGVDLGVVRRDGEEYAGGKLKGESLVELREMFAERNEEDLRWLLDDEVEEEEVGDRVRDVGRKRRFDWNERSGDQEKISWLVHRLNGMHLSIQDWKFPRLMKQSGLFFAENSLLKILEELGKLGSWKQALYVVEWVYSEKEYRHCRSRFVYTKLLAVLGKARRSKEALRIFNVMLDDCQIYPDMAAYHSIAVTLGQAGLVKELVNIIEHMKHKPTKKLKNMRHKNWEPCLDPDIIIYNAVINACVPTRQWKGVFWVLQQMRHSDLRPNGATYGLAMEVMLEAGKYDLVQKLFGTMQRNGLALKALTYKVLVRAFWREGKVHEAIMAVRDMEQRGIIGAVSVYYELACCLCNNGMWKDALLEVEKLKKLPLTKPLEVTFTGMIQSAMDGGHLHDCVSIFKCMKGHCVPNIGTINVMLKVYSRRDMFAKAKELFESAKVYNSDFKPYPDVAKFLTPDLYTYMIMLEASATSHQWEYFEHLYKEMVVCGYQLDQNKSMQLLVEASKAGKWHLLEHAFNAILEAGHIPHVSLFTEMLCQAVAHQTYERVIPLINGMAHASLHVSERQWMNLFEKNRDRVDEDKMRALLDLLGKSDIVTEDPVPSLIKSLQHFFSTRKKMLGGPISPIVALNDNSMFDNHEVVQELDGGFPDVMLTVPKDGPMDHLGTIENCREVKAPNEKNRKLQWNKPAIMLMTEGNCDVRCDKESIHLDVYDDTFASGFLADFGGSDSTQIHSLETLTGGASDLITSHIETSYRSELPSASHILEEWKQKRMKDNVFPFQH